MRQGWQAIITAAATVVPAGTVTEWPFTVKVREMGDAGILLSVLCCKQYRMRGASCTSRRGLVCSWGFIQKAEYFDKVVMYI